MKSVLFIEDHSLGVRMRQQHPVLKLETLIAPGHLLAICRMYWERSEQVRWVLFD